MIDTSLLIFGVGSVATIGASWGVAKKTIQSSETRLDKHVEKDEQYHTDSIDRLARLETKIDLLMEKVK